MTYADKPDDKRWTCMMSEQPLEFPAEAFDKVDATDDALFYALTRLVTHIDGNAAAALTAFYRAALPTKGVILDLMSSWVSHLPSDLIASAVIGHGMNAQELAANPCLTQRFVQDLNRTTELPLDTASLDAALCCVGVQYLQKPIEVFKEVARALRPRASFVVSFSNRCFPTKAVAVWRALDGNGHASLVRFYLEQAGFDDVEVQFSLTGRQAIL